MKIIIVGDGKVGLTLTEQLSKEGHDIVIIDRNQQVLRDSQEAYDVMVVNGNGASMKILKEAGADTADLLIAATSADEINMLCCITAKKMGCRHTIARVRNPEYHWQLSFLKEELGLNEPLPVQYLDYMKGIFQGDFGESYKNGLPIREILPDRMAATLKLTFAGIVWAVVLGTLIGILSAVKRGKFLDYLGMVIATSGISVPSFWLGLILIQIFAVELGWLPTGQLDSWTAGRVTFCRP